MSEFKAVPKGWSMSKCDAMQFSDQMSCACGNVWDMNDPDPPKCRRISAMTTNKPEVGDE